MAAELRQAVAKLLRRTLAEAEMSQDDLAQATGLSKGRISHILHEDRNLTLDTIDTLAEAMGCKVAVVIEPRTESFTIHLSAGGRGEDAYGWWVTIAGVKHGPYDLCPEREAIRQAFKAHAAAESERE